jgi:hypothetical protein
MAIRLVALNSGALINTATTIIHIVRRTNQLGSTVTGCMALYLPGSHWQNTVNLQLQSDSRDNTLRVNSVCRHQRGAAVQISHYRNSLWCAPLLSPPAGKSTIYILGAG